MSDDRSIYEVDRDLPLTLDAFKDRSCCLPWDDNNYTTPKPEEISRLLELAGWSMTMTAKIVGVHYSSSKGSSTVRRWKTTKGESREIPYSAWRLFLICAGVVSATEETNRVKQH